MVNPYATVPMRLSRAPGLVFPNLTILWAIYWVGSTYPSGKLYFGLCQLARSTPKVSNIARAHIAPSIYSEENPNTPKQPKNIFPTFFLNLTFHGQGWSQLIFFIFFILQRGTSLGPPRHSGHVDLYRELLRERERSTVGNFFRRYSTRASENRPSLRAYY